MAHIFRVVVGVMWCGYGACALLHSVLYTIAWMSPQALNIETPAVDTAYYLMSAWVCRHYVRLGLRKISRVLREVATKAPKRGTTEE